MNFEAKGVVGFAVVRQSCLTIQASRKSKLFPCQSLSCLSSRETWVKWLKGIFNRNCQIHFKIVDRDCIFSVFLNQYTNGIKEVLWSRRSPFKKVSSSPWFYKSLSPSPFFAKTVNSLRGIQYSSFFSLMIRDASFPFGLQETHIQRQRRCTQETLRVFNSFSSGFGKYFAWNGG